MACLGRTSRQHRCAVLLQFVASPRRAVHVHLLAACIPPCLAAAAAAAMRVCLTHAM
jgi:hypothetical protein